MKKTKTRLAQAVSLRAKVKDSDTIEVVVTDSITNEVFSFVFNFRNVVGFKYDKLPIGAKSQCSVSKLQPQDEESDGGKE